MWTFHLVLIKYVDNNLKYITQKKLKCKPKLQLIKNDNLLR